MKLNSSSNLLLSALPADSYRRLEPELKPQIFTLGQILYHPDDEINQVYFPSRGALGSVVAHTEDGSSVEVGIAGYDGCVGLNALLGAKLAVHEILIQIAGSGVSISKKTLLTEFNSCREMREVFLLHTQSVMTFIAQTALCNRLHTFEERLARWLLICNDRVGDEINTTQEFLAKMLGSSRATVNLAAGNLQRNGIIKYNRGKVAIKDRAGLEEVSCECYGILKRHQFPQNKSGNSIVLKSVL